MNVSLKSGLLLLALAYPRLATAGGFTFGPPELLKGQYGAIGNVAIGDVNGDRRLDVAVATTSWYNQRTLWLMMQRADGTLAPAMEFPIADPSIASGISISLADLDTDGIDEIILGTGSLDLIVARYDGTSNLAIARFPGGISCHYQAVDDIDADGHLDVACHDWQFSATFFFGDGNRGFQTRRMMTPAGAYDPYHHFKGMRLGDVTGDGLPDLLLTDSLINSFFVHQNDGERGFLPARTYVHPPSPYDVFSPALDLIDLDRDGVMEVVTASPENGPTAMVNVHRRQESGFFKRTERVRSHDSITATQVHDLDGDGAAELIAGHYDFAAVTVMRPEGDGFAPPVRYDLPGFLGHSNGLALGDVTGDGCVDLVAATSSGAWLLRGCAPRETRLPKYDYDSDGVSDILWQDPVNATPMYWPWGERTNFGGPDWHLRYAPGRLAMQAQGDFDGDGGTDVFRRNLDSGENEYVGDVWYRYPLEPVEDQDWQVVGAGDFDGDDRADLLWRNGRTGDNVIWRSAMRSTQQAMAPVRDLAWTVAGIGDFDHDKRSDILWRHALTGRNVIWHAADRDAQKALPRIRLEWTVSGIGDFDGDGRDDVAWRHSGNGNNTIWLGADAARQKAVHAVRDQRWRVAAVGDYNGDGEDDLLWRMRVTGRNVIWLSADAKRQKQVDQTPDRFEVIR